LIQSRLRTDWLLLAGFCGFLFFFGLSFFGLMGADEPRYAQVAREMLARHDWITPTLGGTPWLEKPPLYYWQAMIAYALFGVSDWSARLPSAIDATLMVVGIYFFLKRFRPGSHLDGALMTASAAGVIGFARAASTDMPLAAMFTLALLAWYGWYESEQKYHLGAFYFFVGLGMLAKGPVAPFLAGVIVLLFVIAKGEWSLLRRTLWLPGILIFLVVAAPWFVAVQLKNPDFFKIFVLQHNLQRFGSNLYHHREPIWYYVPVALLGLLPWVVFAITGIVETIRAWWAEKKEMLRGENSLDVFLLTWLIVPIIFFSMSQSKLPGYILPALPAGTLLLAQYVKRHAGERPSWPLVVLHGALAASPIFGALMIQYLILQHRVTWGQAALISGLFATVIAIAIGVTLRTRAGMEMLRFVTLIPVVLAVAALLRLGSPALDSSLSARPLAQELAHLESKQLPLAVYRTSRETEFGLAFYRNQVIERYGRDPIPSEELLVVAPSASQTELAMLVPGRRVSYLGSYAAQGLDYYWVAASSQSH